MNSPSDKKVTCLFLGSGASNALAGIPLQNQFLCSMLNEEKASWINNCGVEGEIKIGDIPLSSWILDIGDVELCMSYLHNRADYEDSSPCQSKRNARRAIVNIRVAIADYLRNIRLKRDIRIKFLKWFKKLHDESSVIVILTTNYDLILEKLLLSLKYKCHYPGIPNKQEGIPIYKLHGSVNWLEKLWFEGEDLKHSPTRLPVVFPVRGLLPKPVRGTRKTCVVFRSLSIMAGSPFRTAMAMFVSRANLPFIQVYPFKLLLNDFLHFICIFFG